MKNDSKNIFKDSPEWFKRNLGKVIDRVGNKGTIRLHEKRGNKVILKLIKEDSSFELLPASIALSELILNGKMKLNEVMDHEILELSNGYICISTLYGAINLDDIKPSEYEYKDKGFLPPEILG